MEDIMDLREKENSIVNIYSKEDTLAISSTSSLNFHESKKLEPKKNFVKSKLSNSINQTKLKKVQKKHDRELELKLEVEKMRKSLPKYSLSQIRLFRLPFHEALITNLRESGYPISASLIEALINYQEEMREESGPGTSDFALPQLKFSKNELGILARNFKKAELKNIEKSYSDECHILLKLGVTFAFNNMDWWWVGEKIIFHSIKISSTYSPNIGHKFEALSRYSYARFLMENLKEFDIALRQLEITLPLTKNKVWTSKAYFANMRGTLYMQTNQAIFECLIKEVERSMEVDVGRTIILADQARKRAANACLREGETRALVIKGICEMSQNHPKSAINSFNKAMIIQERFGTIEGICKIKIQLAKAYLMDGCAISSLNTLLELKSHAEEYGLPFYLAHSYKALGEHYLMIGEPHKASSLLQESINIFKSCTTASKETEDSHGLRAISGGLQLFPNYVDVIRKAGNHDTTGRENLLALLAWKDERRNFWKDEDHIIEYPSCEDIIQESLEKVQRTIPKALDTKSGTPTSGCTDEKPELQFIHPHQTYRDEGKQNTYFNKIFPAKSLVEDKSESDVIMQMYMEK